ncbi:unnamed protein product [Heterotrigona itama]|uniref:Uncharacterized protein n=1 Tax=Heterotrigona itama TaxID=395501 RepID=A0A6V7HH56_9HYME|nr:unnamed protein product [Heterotrigona itama]
MRKERRSFFEVNPESCMQAKFFCEILAPERSDRSKNRRKRARDDLPRAAEKGNNESFGVSILTRWQYGSRMNLNPKNLWIWVMGVCTNTDSALQSACKGGHKNDSIVSPSTFESFCSINASVLESTHPSKIGRSSKKIDREQ